MQQISNVISALKCCFNGGTPRCRSCPYYKEDEAYDCEGQMAEDAVQYLEKYRRELGQC